MNRLLQALGLMRVSEPYPYAVVDQLEADSQLLGKMKRERDEFEAKFKKAITDLAAARDEVAKLQDELINARGWAEHHHTTSLQRAQEIAELTPDALAMRRKRERDRDRRKGKV